jgi:WD40 repeat protein
VVLEGHSKGVKGVRVLTDGRLLTLSWDETWRLWDANSGSCLAVAPADHIVSLHPEWLHALLEVEKPRSVAKDFFVSDSSCQARLIHRSAASMFTVWHGDSEVQARCLLTDGTLGVTQANGQVCILKLHNGHRRVSIAEAQEILDSQRNEKK